MLQAYTFRNGRFTVAVKTTLLSLLIKECINYIIDRCANIINIIIDWFILFIINTAKLNIPSVSVNAIGSFASCTTNPVEQ